MEPLTVYYDGGCALCNAEISYYRKLDRAGLIRWEDISSAEFQPPDNVTSEALMKRLHVRDETGVLHRGISAFARLWQTLGTRYPLWGVLGHIVALPGIKQLAVLLYRLFLVVRPFFRRPQREDRSCPSCRL